jgi:hypothetical protein
VSNKADQVIVNVDDGGSLTHALQSLGAEPIGFDLSTQISALSAQRRCQLPNLILTASADLGHLNIDLAYPSLSS